MPHRKVVSTVMTFTTSRKTRHAHHVTSSRIDTKPQIEPRTWHDIHNTRTPHELARKRRGSANVPRYTTTDGGGDDEDDSSTGWPVPIISPITSHAVPPHIHPSVRPSTHESSCHFVDPTQREIASMLLLLLLQVKGNLSNSRPQIPTARLGPGPPAPSACC